MKQILCHGDLLDPCKRQAKGGLGDYFVWGSYPEGIELRNYSAPSGPCTILICYHEICKWRIRRRNATGRPVTWPSGAKILMEEK